MEIQLLTAIHSLDVRYYACPPSPGSLANEINLTPHPGPGNLIPADKKKARAELASIPSGIIELNAQGLGL